MVITIIYGDTTTSALKTVGEAIDHVAEGGTIILLR